MSNGPQKVTDPIFVNPPLLGRTFTRLTRVSLVTRVWCRFFGALFGQKHRKISREPLERALFLIRAKVGLHETLVIVPSDSRGTFIANPFPPYSLQKRPKPQICPKFVPAIVLGGSSQGE